MASETTRDSDGLTVTATDPVFSVLRWVAVALMAFTLYYCVMDLVQQNWVSFLTSAILTMLLAMFIAIPSFQLATATTTIGPAGISRSGGWSITWDQIAKVSTEPVKDQPYLAVVPREKSRSTDLSRFFLRRTDIPATALVAPIPRACEGDVRDALATYRP